MKSTLPLETIAYNLASQSSPKHVHLLVAPDAVWAQYIYECLKFWQGSDAELYWFSDWETLPYDQYTPHPELVSERLRVLAELPTRQNGILVTSATAIRQRLCPQTHLDKFGIHLSVGDTLPQKTFIHRLIEAGYQENTFIAEKGEYSTRGNIIDLYPMAAKLPIRLEWFDDEIDSIRTFALDTQLTVEKKQSISILPSRELDLSAAGRVCFRQSSRLLLGEQFTKSGIYQSLSDNRTPQGLEYYLPLFFDDTATLFDYLPKNTHYVNAGELLPALKKHEAYCERRYERLNPLREHGLLAPEKCWLPAEEVSARLKALPEQTLKNRCELISFTGSAAEREKDWLARINQAPATALHFSGNGLREHWFERLHKANDSAVLADKWQREASARTRLFVSPVRYSFTADGVMHLAESNLHVNASATNYRENRQKNAGNVIQSLQDLTVGSPVVHIDHGVGRYQGLQKIDDDEMLVIDYAKGAKLYVSVDDLDLISKYTGGPAESAPLHELGSKSWQRSKTKAKQAVNDTATELLAIYAKREAATGKTLKFNHEQLDELARGFDYEETPDQLATIDAVLADLERPQPMDRIVCGDVGFGKTEVAIRAAYAAVLAGYQVAIIAPTTLLAEQHEHNFRDRFADFAVSIEAMSRFKSQKEQKAVLERMQAGTVDIVIGTHRLLQKDVHFKKLGLVIVDEEQRFGVKHKESLKNLRADVNLLTLTATPIPRTLNFALTGLRDLSIIATPPVGRQSIQTVMTAFDMATIEEACERELNRGGQVYFLHNDVASIERMARQIADVLPNARVAVAHGQMPERELERIMQAFYNRHYDILVASTIIESGIDIPNANTIIINRADKLGLAQLHQLRGRVGRSHHQAYAYLITPSWELLTKDAQRRLDAFISVDSLGAGFLLASQDLEIRGAGEILGDEQSGQIQQIGMSYYLDLLDRATKALKAGESLSIDDSDEKRHEIDLGVPAIIPDTYIYDPQIRLTLYQQLARADSLEAINDIQIAMIDRFGLLPAPAKQLLHKAQLRVLAKAIDIESIIFSDDDIQLAFAKEAHLQPDVLFKEMQNAPQRYRMTSPTSLSIHLPDATLEARIETLMQFLNDIREPVKAEAA